MEYAVLETTAREQPHSFVKVPAAALLRLLEKAAHVAGTEESKLGGDQKARLHQECLYVLRNSE